MTTKSARRWLAENEEQSSINIVKRRRWTSVGYRMVRDNGDNDPMKQNDVEREEKTDKRK
jgi:hypothetical protein